MLAGITLSAPAWAGNYSGIFAFGDSLSDTGNLLLATSTPPGIPGVNPQPVPPYSNGRFSNGPVWVQDLSASLGLGAVTPSLGGGNDYAFGGAQTGNTVVNPVGPGNSIDLPSQLAQFQASHTTAPSNALYTVWIGSNDLFFGLATGNAATALTVEKQAVANVDGFLGGLAALGARNILLVGVPDLGLIPLFGVLNPAYAADATALTNLFNFDLAKAANTTAATDGLKLSFLNTAALIDAAVANPGAFGFTDVTHPCWTGSYDGGPNSGTLCGTTSAAQDTHLFWDYIHPTEAGAAIVAAAAFTEVPEPDSLALLATGLSLGALMRTVRRRQDAARL